MHACEDIVKIQISELMLPSHANPAGNVHGGTIMRLIDETAYIIASRYTHKNCVTASVDQISFLAPVFIGNLVSASAIINFTGKTSMEIGVHVDAEDLRTGIKTHVASAFLTFVAFDDKNHPVEIPKLIPKTSQEIKRFQEAEKRHQYRDKLRTQNNSEL